MELSFLQKVILLALNNQGWFGASENKIKFGLVGAILFELYKKERIRFQDNGIRIINPKSTESVLLDRVLNLIKSSEKQRTLRSWIQFVVSQKLLLRKTVLKQLTEGRIVRKEEYNMLRLFSQTKYPLVNSEIKRKLQQDLFETIELDKEITDYDRMLLVIMHDCRMIRKNFGSFPEFKKISLKIGEIVHAGHRETEPEQVIGLLQTAISRAMIASSPSFHL
jgi:hypothetical protein